MSRMMSARSAALTVAATAAVLLSAMPVSAIPAGYHSITPYLTVVGVPQAIEFYKAAFGAEEAMRMPADDGKRLMHGHIKINGGSVMLNDDFPEYGGGKPAPGPGGPGACPARMPRARRPLPRLRESPT